jgi:aminoglycoside/choline kinase family phosphotransferase
MSEPPRGLDLAPLEALVRTLGARGPLHVVEMPGGASTRRYFRVALDGFQAKAAVAMFVPEGGKPEEIAKVASAKAARWPFLEVRDLLAASGVDVPALYAEDQERGWLLLEDLGDDTLANHLAHTTDASARERLYRQAVLDLSRAQRALAALPPDSVIRARAFDEDLLRWEIDHFREWGLEARDLHLSPAARISFDAIAARLASRIASWPRGFVHRDYQSRNLMVRQGSGALSWIDFQDALLGPRVYDLVALLNDSYQTFDRPFVLARLADYANESPSDELVQQFDYVTVQRKLKDAGRFVFIHRKKGNDAFLRFVAPTLRKVDESLGRLAHDPDMRTLHAILSHALQVDSAKSP